ncbi:hypothetical protein NDU88_004398 [Pleurodeles waltl]|uniref:Uncharacterized protein n=1 Tax=Pleurodeles waltl TaxID=8319 RepID=A0AAV7WA91_PLEWA|nr:hypothetical protein NDU88_004398 [Pleurodeles waltl]
MLGLLLSRGGAGSISAKNVQAMIDDAVAKALASKKKSKSKHLDTLGGSDSGSDLSSSVPRLLVGSIFPTWSCLFYRIT